MGPFQLLVSFLPMVQTSIYAIADNHNWLPKYNNYTKHLMRNDPTFMIDSHSRVDLICYIDQLVIYEIEHDVCARGHYTKGMPP